MDWRCSYWSDSDENWVLYPFLSDIGNREIVQSVGTGLKGQTWNFLGHCVSMDVKVSDNSGMDSSTPVSMDVKFSDNSGTDWSTPVSTDVKFSDNSGTDWSTPVSMDVKFSDNSGMDWSTPVSTDVKFSDNSGMDSSTPVSTDVKFSDNSGMDWSTPVSMDVKFSDNSGMDSSTPVSMDVKFSDNSGMDWSTPVSMDVKFSDNSGMDWSIPVSMDVKFSDNSGMDWSIPVSMDVKFSDNSGMDWSTPISMDVKFSDNSGMDWNTKVSRGSAGVNKSRLKPERCSHTTKIRFTSMLHCIHLDLNIIWSWLIGRGGLVSKSVMHPTVNTFGVAYKAVEFFLNNTNLTFLVFCTKLTTRGFKISKNKIASTGNWTHNTNHLWIRILTALPTQPICQSMPVSDFQTLMKSCSSRIFYSTDVFGSWMGKAVRILNHRWLVLWVQFPVEATLFLLILLISQTFTFSECSQITCYDFCHLPWPVDAVSLEFSLNGPELSLNSGNLENLEITEACIGFNTGWVRLIRSLLSATFSFELSRFSN